MKKKLFHNDCQRRFNCQTHKKKYTVRPTNSCRGHLKIHLHKLFVTLKVYVWNLITAFLKHHHFVLVKLLEYRVFGKCIKNITSSILLVKLPTARIAISAIDIDRYTYLIENTIQICSIWGQECWNLRSKEVITESHENEVHKNIYTVRTLSVKRMSGHCRHLTLDLLRVVVAELS